MRPVINWIWRRSSKPLKSRRLWPLHRHLSVRCDAATLLERTRLCCSAGRIRDQAHWSAARNAHGLSSRRAAGPTFVDFFADSGHPGSRRPGFGGPMRESGLLSMAREIGAHLAPSPGSPPQGAQPRYVRVRVGADRAAFKGSVVESKKRRFRHITKRDRCAYILLDGDLKPLNRLSALGNRQANFQGAALILRSNGFAASTDLGRYAPDHRR